MAVPTRHELALERQLETVNDRLKEAKRRVRVVVPSKRHRTLHLRATLPAKPEEAQGPAKRKYIKLEVAYTAQGVEEAELLAIDLNSDITDWRNGRAFDWPKWEKLEAPGIAKDYWELPDDAMMRDVLMAVRADEANHRDVNHGLGEIKTTDPNPFAPVKIGGSRNSGVESPKEK